MCCFALLLTGLGPRVALVFAWIFGNRVELAFDSWIWPLLGIFLLPWTTLMYIIVWDPAGLSGAEWILVAIGFALDLATYSARAAKGRTSYY